MKRLIFAGWTVFCALSVLAEAPPAQIYETAAEFFGSGDFDGDGRADLVIVDKESGKYRLGYQLASGAFSWVDCRPSGINAISGFTIGKLLKADRDALAFASPDANQFTIVDASNPKTTARPVSVPFSAALGPSLITAAKIGGPGKGSLDDFLITSIYNSPVPNLATLLRNDGREFPKIADGPLDGPAARGQRLRLKPGQADLVCLLVRTEKGDTLLAENLGNGKAETVASVSGLSAESDYVIGKFRGKVLPELLLYKSGENKFSLRAFEESGKAQVQFAAEKVFDLGSPLQRLVSLNQGGKTKLLAILDAGKKAILFEFDGDKPPVSLQTFFPTNDVFTCALDAADGFMLFGEPGKGKFSTRYYSYISKAATYAFNSFGGLPSLADNDNMTIPEIHARIVEKATEKTEADMKLYTNTIPGTRISYAMAPIPGGEFLMGSPEAEPGHKPEEGPQHKVRISPFWMGQCEVTWNEYELFMFPDEEKKIRETISSDSGNDKLADAVAHPSKPYAEMSFGMGKDGYPAISMTQHGANKYCQWLSAKTGQFYRLPTEAEWEYACRAGTTTPYFFGNDTNRLGDYAWFEQNTEFKYYKVAKKKPNPWGLYDICGNVLEWVLDQYDPDYYKQCAGKGVVTDPWNKATRPYPHSVRGGSWYDDALMCRSATRRGSDRVWKMTDPQLPKSMWYFTDAPWVGFRLVRPLKIPPAEEMQKCWSSGVEKE